MPLVTCPDCAQQFEDGDPSCSHCGRTNGDAAAAAKAGPRTPRPAWRRGAGHAIAIIGMFTGLFVMMVSLPVGLLVLAASGVIGWWLSVES